MATVLVRDLDETTVERLRDRAKKNGRSLEAELRLVLRDVANSLPPFMTLEEFREHTRELRESLGSRVFSDTSELLREDRDSH